MEAATTATLFRQQFLDPFLGQEVVIAPLPVEFPIPPESRVAFFVDQVDARPHRVAPEAPVVFFVVDQDRKFQAFLFCICTNVGDTVFIGEFGSVDADNSEFFVSERFVPILVPRIISNAIDSGEGVKMQCDNFAFQFVERQWFGV